MFFAGRLPRPPWETRGRVEAMVKRLDRTHINNYGGRFRFTTLQIAVLDVHRSLGSRAARARGRTAGSVRATTAVAEEKPKAAAPRIASCTSPPSAIR